MTGPTGRTSAALTVHLDHLPIWLVISSKGARQRHWHQQCGAGTRAHSRAAYAEGMHCLTEAEAPLTLGQTAKAPHFPYLECRLSKRSCRGAMRRRGVCAITSGRGVGCLATAEVCCQQEMKYASPTALIERPVRPFTKLFVRPIAFLALLSLEIGRNGAKVQGVSRLLLSYRRSNCTVARRNRHDHLRTQPPQPPRRWRLRSRNRGFRPPVARARARPRTDPFDVGRVQQLPQGARRPWIGSARVASG